MVNYRIVRAHSKCWKTDVLNCHNYTVWVERIGDGGGGATLLSATPRKPWENIKEKDIISFMYNVKAKKIYLFTLFAWTTDARKIISAFLAMYFFISYIFLLIRHYVPSVMLFPTFIHVLYHRMFKYPPSYIFVRSQIMDIPVVTTAKKS